MALSRFAGLINAIDFAYGCAGPGVPPALVIGQAQIAGTLTQTLEFGYVTLADGLIFKPLNINAPVNVGSGTNSEQVTPSAVSANTPTQLNTTTMTGVFANAHGLGDLVSSATFGAQEAINYANSIGGGTVILSPGWATLGGTTAIIAALVIPANVSIMDNRTGSGTPSVATFTVANAAVLTLHSAPLQLLAAPGAGEAYDIIDAIIEYKYLTAAFTGGGVISVNYGNGATPLATSTVAATFLTAPAANEAVKLTGALADSLLSAVVNKGLFLYAATQDFAAGGGSLVVKVTYRVVSGLT